MASGKSTTAQALAPGAAPVRPPAGDLFRRMIVTGREEMRSAHRGAAAAAPPLPAGSPGCAGYWEAGFSVVLQDNYYGPALEEMASLFAGHPPCAWWSSAPSVETVRAREASRGKRGYVGFPQRPLWHSFMRETPLLAGQLPYDGGTGCEGDPLRGRNPAPCA